MSISEQIIGAIFNAQVVFEPPTINLLQSDFNTPSDNLDTSISEYKIQGDIVSNPNDWIQFFISSTFKSKRPILDCYQILEKLF